MQFKQNKLSSKQLKMVLICSFALMIVAIPLTLINLENSEYSGDLYQTQLGFDGGYIRNHFENMSEDQMSYFIIGNLFDYLFMISYSGFLFSAASLITQNIHYENLWKKSGSIISIIGLLAGVFDAFENVFIILMAFSHKDFPLWLAIPHSCFAWMKFICLYTAFAWISLSFIALMILKLFKADPAKIETPS